MRKTILSGAVAVSALLCSVAAPAQAQSAGNYTFDWVGNCVDCAAAAGTATFEVKARLQVQDYILGSRLSYANLVRFDYFGSNLVDAYSAIPAVDNVGFIDGAIDSLPGGYRFVISKEFAYIGGEHLYRTFATQPGETFTVGQYKVFEEDYGTGTWNSAIAAVPEPETWAMMIVGLGALSVALRRRQKAGRLET